MSDTQGTPALKKTSHTLPLPESHSTPKSQGALFQLNTSTRTEELSFDWLIHTPIAPDLASPALPLESAFQPLYDQRRTLRFGYLYSIGTMHLETLGCCVIRAMARCKMSFSALACPVCPTFWLSDFHDSE
ncbi:hypothetical protein D8B26_000825 [Coccidioides posadasii str. Silveira]|uniref:uncharacterized protein n=1 Tax=Coccidioides posadasii (strain RMSCC 757 / Silveira) TaxID=443226 RepID=UPI001BEDA552|nr:hypothetical protein D8B26_000825 [Coccidioides posadasii str. Silveira]